MLTQSEQLNADQNLCQEQHMSLQSFLEISFHLHHRTLKQLAGIAVQLLVISDARPVVAQSVADRGRSS